MVLKALRLAALRDSPTAFGVTHASAAANEAQQWRDRAAGRGPASYLLAFEGDVPVGMIGGVVSAAQEFNLIAMWVRPESRGSGAAAALVEALKAPPRAPGPRRGVLGVAPAHARAAAFYQRRGFRFLPHWEALESHPHIQLQKMEWRSASA